MFRTLRNRLVFSHILPLFIIIPLMGIVLVYGLENWIYIPNLSDELEADARLIARTLSSDPGLWRDPDRANELLSTSTVRENARITLITTGGILFASSAAEDNDQLQQPVDLTGFSQALEGQAISQIHYSRRLSADVIDIFMPVISPSRDFLGIVRLTFQYATVADEFYQLRYLIFGLLAAGILIGSILGYLLALSIESPVRSVTQAVDELARGSSTKLLKVYGPDEIQKLAMAVNLLFTRLRALENSRRQLLANLVHELGRPLGALRSAIQALGSGAEKQPEIYRELVNGMEEESARLEHLLNDLAHLHEQVLGPLELNLQPLQVNDWLPNMVRTWQEAAREKDIRWQLETADDLPVVQADPARLGQVVSNLVGNAIKFTPPGGQIVISTGMDQGQIWISVRDSGPGIAADEQQRIFDPFYRGSPGRRFPQGMGLGLSIANDLVKAHSGTIQVDSAEGSGSRFTIFLPA